MWGASISVKRGVHMFQSCVEIPCYSVAYFNHIAAIEAQYHRTSVKVGLMSFVDSLDIHASTKHV